MKSVLLLFLVTNDTKIQEFKSEIYLHTSKINNSTDCTGIHRRWQVVDFFGQRVMLKGMLITN